MSWGVAEEFKAVTTDIVSPSITLLNGDGFVLLGSKFNESLYGFIATDDVSGVVTSKVYKDVPTMDSVGEYVITYHVFDLAGNTYTTTRKVVVVETLEVTMVQITDKTHYINTLPKRPIVVTVLDAQLGFGDSALEGPVEFYLGKDIDAPWLRREGVRTILTSVGDSSRKQATVIFPK